MSITIQRKIKRSLNPNSVVAQILLPSGVVYVEYSGSSDGLVRFWENEDGEGLKSSKNVSLHSGGVLPINAGEDWLGIGAAHNTMSLFHRPQERLGGGVSKIST
ncbi:hypothetical protein L2E82_26905 [Cichorium intybus]|uniref:Uncharacterized protein n=1 Tax=Cichorium intybus TaxID=13427 RepID=A0ACB9CS56_CICIN|nr:hypothetical protein L2E82_26905 [Cichorium intybus]